MLGDLQDLTAAEARARRAVGLAEAHVPEQLGLALLGLGPVLWRRGDNDAALATPVDSSSETNSLTDVSGLSATFS